MLKLIYVFALRYDRSINIEIGSEFFKRKSINYSRSNVSSGEIYSINRISNANAGLIVDGYNSTFDARIEVITLKRFDYDI